MGIVEESDVSSQILKIDKILDVIQEFSGIQLFLTGFRFDGPGLITTLFIHLFMVFHIVQPS